MAATQAPVTVAEPDLYVPRVATVREITRVGPREKLFQLELPGRSPLGHAPGQFVAVTVFGVGEAPISVSSPPGDQPAFELCVRAVGKLTEVLHAREPGAQVGIRGPFGQGFPVEALTGHDLLFVVGGLGMAPLRSLLLHVLEHRDDFGDVKVMVGARTPHDLLFPDEMLQIGGRADLDLQITVDVAPEGWRGNVGPVTTIVRRASVDPDTTIAVTVGPPAMYRFVLRELMDKRIPDERMYFSLERHMKCGVGKCGHCQMNNLFVCQDGPVFRYDEIRHMPEAI